MLNITMSKLHEGFIFYYYQNKKDHMKIHVEDVALEVIIVL